MPPSQVLRCSPGRELRMENHHKRGRSLESGLPVRVKDGDLTLFNDMQMRERDNFLLHSTDDFEDSLSKLRYFSDFKLTIPVRGESSDLLNVDGEKNDYDWLLTPPDTPLFPSLDDEEPPPVNLVCRGRPRTQPISISRSSMIEKNQRTSRSSASPHRLSPSPRSGNNTLQSRGRPSSAPHSSPTPLLRPTTPSRRPSTPPNKPSTTIPRSSTPTLRRMSTGSSGHASSSGRRGPSPVKTSRGNSSSPKLRGWQSSLPGFSSDPPPNLRTSLSDRPASHTRGLSPASRNGRDSSSIIGRQSMSPTASRSASSSHSHDRDRFSSYSKGSVASSGDDDVDSLHSVSVGISSSPTLRKNGVFVNSRAMTFSRKPSRTPSASSAPKRSFDSALRQMDQRKTPQNMFRPLLSSVPATTFYAGKTSTIHRPMLSRNSSLTTSSNASSEQGASVAPDMEGCYHDQNDIAGEWEKMPDSDAQEEVFIFDKVEEVNEDIGHELCSEKPQDVHGGFGGSMARKIDSEEFERLTSALVDAAVVASTSESSYATGDHSEVDGFEIMAICSKCMKSYHVLEAIDGSIDVCQECAEKDALFLDGIHTAGLPETTLLTTQNTEIYLDMALVTDGSCEESTLGMSVPELHVQTNSQTFVGQPQNSVEQGNDDLSGTCPVELAMDERERRLPDEQLECQQEVVSSSSGSGNILQRLQSFGSHQSSRIDSPEGTGISLLLLKRSSSSKGPVVQGRAFTATSILCAEPSYVRDSVNAMRGSLTQDSSSASSSIDLGSSRQAEARVQRQLSSRKFDVDNMRNDFSLKPQSTEISLSGISSNSSDDLACIHKTRIKETFDGCVGSLDYDILGEITLVTEECEESLENAESCGTHFSPTRAVVPVGEKVDHTGSCRIMDAFSMELLSDTQGICLEDAMALDILNDEDCVSPMNPGDHLQQNARRTKDVDIQAEVADSCVIEEDDVINGSFGGTGIFEALTRSSSGAMLEIEDGHDCFRGSHTECEASQSTNIITESSHAQSVSTTLEEDALPSSLDSNNVDHGHGIHEESTVTVEGPGGHKSRSLTLEEATDTILFCSSIIHDLAYKAATIGMEKEHSSPLETSRPTVTILEKSVSDQKYQKKTSSRRTPKSQKLKRKRLETGTKVPSTESGNNVKNYESPTCNAELPNKLDSTKPPKLESKCNCTVM